MGLYAYAKGLTDETSFACGYITYGTFILELIKTAYGDKCFNMYRNSMIYGQPFSDDDVKYWNSCCNDDLDILIFHSDHDGKFSPKECRRIYSAIKNLHMDMKGHNYGVMKEYNMLEHWKIFSTIALLVA